MARLTVRITTCNKAHLQDDSGMFLLNTRAVSRTEGSNKNTVIILITCLEVTGLCTSCHARLLHAGERDWGSARKWNLLISTLRCF